MTTTALRAPRPVLDPSTLGAEARRIADEVAGPAAPDVDRRARFPSETIEAARAAGHLGALVPAELGGWGATVTEVGESVVAIARRCASSAMVLAMHHLQVACLARHASTPPLRRFQADVADQGLLLASATTEIGTGGQLRTSSCVLETEDGRFRLTKVAPVISYGAHADAVLATARRHQTSPPSDQVLVVCPTATTTLEQLSEWDALGMRGTCSSGFRLEATGPVDHVLAVPFGDIAEQTMLPVSHVLWGFVWLGLAADAVSRARRVVQRAARTDPGSTPPGALRLAEAMVAYRQLEALVRGAARRVDEMAAAGAPGIAAAIASNGLKVGASEGVIDVVTRCLAVCGIAGYRQDSEHSLGRHLRDAHGSAVMVNNDRILADNAHLLLIDKEEL